ncbi:hypothetical protein ABW19_dt0210565 [Dactylella cylindrospora]|nr:hypothetical protein ABW19_dt0210565 [Dactylella cylindrospora]
MSNRRQKIDTEDWETYRPIIRDLYIDQKLTQEQICSRLQEHGFYVEKRQLVHRLKVWGLSRYFKKEDHRQANEAMVARYKRDPDAAMDVYIRGIKVSKQRLKRARQYSNLFDPEMTARMAIARENSSLNAPLFIGDEASNIIVRCVTPPSDIGPMISQIQHIMSIPFFEASLGLPDFIIQYLERVRISENTLQDNDLLSSMMMDLDVDTQTRRPDRFVHFLSQFASSDINKKVTDLNRGWKKTMDSMSGTFYNNRNTIYRVYRDEEFWAPGSGAALAIKLLQFIIYDGTNNRILGDEAKYILEFVKNNDFYDMLDLILSIDGDVTKQFGLMLLEESFNNIDHLEFGANLLESGRIQLPDMVVLELLSREATPNEAVNLVVRHSAISDWEAELTKVMRHPRYGHGEREEDLNDADWAILVKTHSLRIQMAIILHNLLQATMINHSELELMILGWLDEEILDAEDLYQWLAFLLEFERFNKFLDEIINVPAIGRMITEPRFLILATDLNNLSIIRVAVRNGADVYIHCRSHMHPRSRSSIPLVNIILKDEFSETLDFFNRKSDVDPPEMLKLLADMNVNLGEPLQIESHTSWVTQVMGRYFRDIPFPAGEILPLELAIIHGKLKAVIFLHSLHAQNQLEQLLSFERLATLAAGMMPDAKACKRSLEDIPKVLQETGYGTQRTDDSIEGFLAMCVLQNYHEPILGYGLKQAQENPETMDNILRFLLDKVTNNLGHVLGFNTLRTIIDNFQISIDIRKLLIEQYLNRCVVDSETRARSFVRESDIEDANFNQNLLCTMVVYPELRTYAIEVGIGIPPALESTARKESFNDLAQSVCCAKHTARVAAIVPDGDVVGRLWFLEDELVQRTEGSNYITLLSSYNLGIPAGISQMVGDDCEEPRAEIMLSRLESLIRDGRLDINQHNSDFQYILSRGELYFPYNISILKRIIDLGVLVNQPTWPYPHPIIHAARYDNIEGLEILLAKGGKEAINNYGYPPHWTVSQAKRMQKAAGFSQKFNFWETALTSAADHGNVAIAMVLLENGADVNFIPEGGKSPLEKAAKGGRFDMVKLLLNAGAKQAEVALKVTSDKFPHVKQLLMDHILENPGSDVEVEVEGIIDLTGE